MKCAACRPLLSKYVDGEATPAEVRLIEEHIGGCERCTMELTEFRLVQSAFGQMPNRQPDPRLRARLFQAAQTATTLLRWSPSRQASAVIVVVGLA